MLRVMKMEEEDLLQGEVPVALDEESYRMAYQVVTDPKFPGQFRVVSAVADPTLPTRPLCCAVLCCELVGWLVV